MPQHFQDRSLHWVLHSRFSDEDGPVLPIPEKSLQTINDSAEQWRQLDSVEREVWVKVQLLAVQPGLLCTGGFHLQCHRRFTDKTKIASAVKRCAKMGQPSPDKFYWCAFLTRNVECSGSRKTRDQPKRRNSNVLPEQCIICKGEKYTMDLYSSKRQWEKLLFNFLVWITGLSDVVEFDNFLKTADDVQRKLLYVYMD